jgi:hypothetical protein
MFWKIFSFSVPSLKDLAISYLRDHESRRIARDPLLTQDSFDEIRQKEFSFI